MPVPPPSFGPLTTAELLAMEGRERTHVEARLRMLRNTQTLVSAAIVQVRQKLVNVAVCWVIYVKFFLIKRIL